MSTPDTTNITPAMEAEWTERYPTLPSLAASLADTEAVFHEGDPDDLDEDPPIMLHDHALHMAAVLAERTRLVPYLMIRPVEESPWLVVGPADDPMTWTSASQEILGGADVPEVTRSTEWPDASYEVGIRHYTKVEADALEEFPGW